MCKYAVDLVPMMKVLGDEHIKLLKLEEKVDLSKLKIYFMEEDGNPMTTPVDREMSTALWKVLRHFEHSYNITPIPVRFKQFRRADQIYFAKLGSEETNPSFASEMDMRRGEINVWAEWLKCIVGTGKHTVAGLNLATLEKMKGMYVNNARNHEDLEDLKKEFRELLQEDGVLLFPSHPTTAPYHHQPHFRFVFLALLCITDFCMHCNTTKVMAHVRTGPCLFSVNNFNSSSISSITFKLKLY